MANETQQLQCYNRGCGQKYDANNNNEDSCRHHPGQPVFHDAYKGWSCCNKKCTDFTEFLNIKGCALSKHSNIKPPEPEKPVAKEINNAEVVDVKPLVRKSLERPPFDSPLVTMKPEIAPSLNQMINANEMKEVQEKGSDEIVIGTSCKNGGCKETYSGPEINETACIHHPGVPIFHEGLKYWSCCQKKTTDFNSFLGQVGCERGTHVWRKDEIDKNVQCRWDFHQTGSYVVVAIYAKQYSPTESFVKLNPVRLYANLIFPQQSNASFVLDVELRGIVDVAASQVSMLGTKVEIKLKKAEPGSWTKLGDPVIQQPATPDVKQCNVEKLTPKVEAVDLDDL
ncbi:hypothetical protein NQ315_012087 [Exocentrus adspersus]|uniref:Cysteine and histidine-rich domain-containing protein n=1 Tax=Exocentrus adspersus TaxID=1586481 RepID=A0AAV8VYZ4_9CUCU|nr:hypothetical protein NQ315_012087 [Exocentrus adspersus]